MLAVKGPEATMEVSQGGCDSEDSNLIGRLILKLATADFRLRIPWFRSHQPPGTAADLGKGLNFYKLSLYNSTCFDVLAIVK